MTTKNSKGAKGNSKAALKNALDAVNNGMTVHTASKTFDVPKTTLYNHFKNNLNADVKQGAPSVFSKEQEGHLCSWIDHMAKIGFPISKDNLLDAVQLLAKDLQIAYKFRGGRPGRHWYEGFLKRNPSVSKRVSQYLIKSRAQVTEHKIKEWFTEITVYLETNGYLTILDHPERVFNCDETAFFLSPKENSVLVTKGQKSVYSLVANDEKENITTLVMGSALGTLGPPMVVLPYKRIPVSVAKSMPVSWGIGRSDSGWMTGELFFEYIANIFFPWLISNNIQLPIILFVDGHTSHMTLNLSRFCNEKGIILIALLPNSTSILQPMDVAYFHPLKQEWRAAVKNWRMENNGVKMRREDFAPLLSTILKIPCFENNLRNGFKACGLCPFDSNGINYGKLLSNEGQVLPSKEMGNNESATASGSNKMLILLQQNLEHLQRYLGIEKLVNFEKSLACNSWNSDKEDTSLFEYWRYFKISLNDFNDSSNLDMEANINIEEPTLVNNLDIDGMEVDLEMLLGDNTNITLNVDSGGSVTVDNEPQTPIKSAESLINNNLPTPFKQNLIWPSPVGSMPSKKKKLPAVVSSEQWIEFTQLRSDKKIKEQIEKEERKRQREEKKQNIKGSQRESTKPEQIDMRESRVEVEFKIQQYVIVKYEGEFFPGIIEDKKNNEYFVKVMCMSGNNWRWPDKDDVCWYNKTDVIQAIPEPELINARGVYSVLQIKSVRDSN